MEKIYFIIILISVCFSQDCDENMLMNDCINLPFCNNEPDFGFDCFVNNEFCEDFNGDGIVDAWVGDGWCDDGEWGYDFQCEEYSFDCGDCNDDFSNTYGYCDDIPEVYTFNHGGLLRQYYIYEPDNIQENPPLVFLMHGFTGSALGISSYSGMNTLADEHGFVVCYPQGTSDQNGDNFWNVGYNFHDNITVDDVSFIVSLAEYLQNENGYDANNTFAAGMSNGAEMSYKLACETDGFFNAIAPVAGTMFGVSWSSCDPTTIPVLEIHGTNDNVTLWGGDYNDTYWGPYPGIEEVIDFWVEENDCINNEEIVLESMSTIKHRYFDCSDNAEVWLYEVVGGGHDWPGYSSQEIWNFFSSFIGLSGDINQDTLINILDVILVINFILEGEFNSTADINNDDSINVLDVVQLVNIILN
ncbi:dockerin type I domain-containing protein [Candidatus Marinimicrobia bacterium]|nr:dockerin type I domain-containing protein [Candidatus Neomarinimicrobiota bacterium]